MLKSRTATRFNKDGIIKLCQELERKDGKGSIALLGEQRKDGVLNIPRRPTNLTDLDNIIDGGLPEGRIIEIYGAESAGKTALALHLAAQQPLALYIPIEGTFDKDRARIYGNRPKQMLVSNVKYGEGAFNRMIKFARLGIPLIITDSVPSMQPKCDIDKILAAVDKDDETELRLGGIATLMTKYLPALESIIEQTGTTVIFINQIRDKMNAMPYGEQVHTPGGHKLLHADSIKMQVARRDWIKIPNYNPSNSAKNEMIGIIQRCKIVKNKVGTPYGECELPLFFDRGYVEFESVDEIRKEIMENKRAFYKNK